MSVVSERVTNETENFSDFIDLLYSEINEYV